MIVSGCRIVSFNDYIYMSTFNKQIEKCKLKDLKLDIYIFGLV